MKKSPLLFLLLILVGSDVLADRYGVTKYNLRVDGSYGRLEEGDSPYQISTDEFRVRIGGTFPISTYGGVEVSTNSHRSNFNVNDAKIRARETSALFFLRDYDLGAVGLGYTETKQKLGFDWYGLGFSLEDKIENKFVEVQYYLETFTVGLRRGWEDVIDQEELGGTLHKNYFLAHAAWYMSDNFRMRLMLGGMDKSAFRRLTYSYMPNSLERKFAFMFGYGRFSAGNRAPFLESATTSYMGVTYFFNGGPTFTDLDRRREGFLSTWY